MRPESKSPGGTPRPLAELAAEQEVDFSRYWWAIAARWWLVLGAVAVGVVVGYLVSLGGGDVFQAKATVYLGQPLTPSGNAQIQSFQTNPSSVGQIVRSQAVVREVAADLDISAGKLRSSISTKAVAGAVARLGQTQLVEITVRGPWRQKSAEAANRLAETVVGRVSGYADAKIAQLEAQLGAQDRELASIEERLDSLQDAIGSGAGLSPAERLSLTVLVGFIEQRQGQLVDEQTQTQGLLTLASDVERGQVVTEATAVKVAARGRTSSIVVGALIGLVVGIALAILWEPLVERSRRRSP